MGLNSLKKVMGMSDIPTPVANNSNTGSKTEHVENSSNGKDSSKVNTSKKDEEQSKPEQKATSNSNNQSNKASQNNTNTNNTKSGAENTSNATESLKSNNTANVINDIEKSLDSFISGITNNQNDTQSSNQKAVPDDVYAGDDEEDDEEGSNSNTRSDIPDDVYVEDDEEEVPNQATQNIEKNIENSGTAEPISQTHTENEVETEDDKTNKFFSGIENSFTSFLDNIVKNGSTEEQTETPNSIDQLDNSNNSNTSNNSNDEVISEETVNNGSETEETENTSSETEETENNDSEAEETENNDSEAVFDAIGNSLDSFLGGLKTNIDEDGNTVDNDLLGSDFTNEEDSTLDDILFGGSGAIESEINTNEDEGFTDLGETDGDNVFDSLNEDEGFTDLGEADEDNVFDSLNDGDDDSFLFGDSTISETDEDNREEEEPIGSVPLPSENDEQANSDSESNTPNTNTTAYGVDYTPISLDTPKSQLEAEADKAIESAIFSKAFRDNSGEVINLEDLKRDVNEHITSKYSKNLITLAHYNNIYAGYQKSGLSLSNYLESKADFEASDVENYIAIDIFKEAIRKSIVDGVKIADYNLIVEKIIADKVVAVLNKSNERLNSNYSTGINVSDLYSSFIEVEKGIEAGEQEKYSTYEEMYYIRYAAESDNVDTVNRAKEMLTLFEDLFNKSVEKFKGGSEPNLDNVDNANNADNANSTDNVDNANNADTPLPITEPITNSDNSDLELSDNDRISKAIKEESFTDEDGITITVEELRKEIKKQITNNYNLQIVVFANDYILYDEYINADDGISEFYGSEFKKITLAGKEDIDISLAKNLFESAVTQSINDNVSIELSKLTVDMVIGNRLKAIIIKANDAIQRNSDIISKKETISQAKYNELIEIEIKEAVGPLLTSKVEDEYYNNNIQYLNNVANSDIEDLLLKFKDLYRISFNKLVNNQETDGTDRTDGTDTTDTTDATGDNTHNDSFNNTDNTDDTNNTDNDTSNDNNSIPILTDIVPVNSLIKYVTTYNPERMLMVTYFAKHKFFFNAMNNMFKYNSKQDMNRSLNILGTMHYLGKTYGIGNIQAVRDKQQQLWEESNGSINPPVYTLAILDAYDAGTLPYGVNPCKVDRSFFNNALKAYNKQRFEKLNNSRKNSFFSDADFDSTDSNYDNSSVDHEDSPDSANFEYNPFLSLYKLKTRRTTPAQRMTVEKYMIPDLTKSRTFKIRKKLFESKNGVAYLIREYWKDILKYIKREMKDTSLVKQFGVIDNRVIVNKKVVVLDGIVGIPNECSVDLRDIFDIHETFKTFPFIEALLVDEPCSEKIILEFGLGSEAVFKVFEAYPRLNSLGKLHTGMDEPVWFHRNNLEQSKEQLDKEAMDLEVKMQVRNLCASADKKIGRKAPARVFRAINDCGNHLFNSSLSHWKNSGEAAQNLYKVLMDDQDQTTKRFLSNSLAVPVSLTVGGLIAAVGAPIKLIGSLGKFATGQYSDKAEDKRNN